MEHSSLLDGLDDLDDILVVEEVVPAHSLGLELDAGAPHHGVLQLRENAAVDLVTEVLHGTSGGFMIIWTLSMHPLL